MNSDDSAAAQTARNQYTDLRLRVAAAARANDGVALEDHLRAPVQSLVESVAEDLGYPKLVLAGEISGGVEGARPDYTVTRGGLVIGHIELKGPGARVDPEGFTGHNLEQWQQLRHLPNLLYTEEVRLGSIYEPISRERRVANRLKTSTPVMVAIGNPPYRERAKGLGRRRSPLTTSLPPRCSLSRPRPRRHPRWRRGLHRLRRLSSESGI